MHSPPAVPPVPAEVEGPSSGLPVDPESEPASESTRPHSQGRWVRPAGRAGASTSAVEATVIPASVCVCLTGPM